MSILTNAEQIRDETIALANSAARVGGNLVEIANDLVAKQTAILLNTAKVGIATGQAAAIVLNTAKVGITTGQAAAIVLNTAKVGYTEAAVDANASVVANAAAILTKIGNDGSPISVTTANVLTTAAYNALGTKVATRLYFLT